MNTSTSKPRNLAKSLLSVLAMTAFIATGQNQQEKLQTAEYLYLDRGNYRTKDPEPKQLPDKYYQVQSKPPYQIILPPAEETTKAKVAILDHTTEIPVERSQNLVIVASHFQLVKSKLENTQPVCGYSVGSATSEYSIDRQKVEEVLNYLIANHKELNISLVNMSFGSGIKPESITEIIKKYSGSNDYNGLKITHENVHKYADVFRNALENMSDKDDFYKSILHHAHLVEKLIAQGVAVVKSAGNEKDKIDYLSILVPDIIVVGDMPSTYNHPENMPAFSDSNLIDAGEDAIEGVLDPQGQLIVLKGTSFAAPKICADVIELLEQGISVRDINRILRLRTKQEIEEEAMSLSHMLGKKIKYTDNDLVKNEKLRIRRILSIRAKEGGQRELFIGDVSKQIKLGMDIMDFPESRRNKKRSITQLLKASKEYEHEYSILYNERNLLKHTAKMSFSLQDLLEVLDTLNFVIKSPVSTEDELNNFFDYFDSLSEKDREIYLGKLRQQADQYERIEILLKSDIF